MAEQMTSDLIRELQAHLDRFGDLPLVQDVSQGVGVLGVKPVSVKCTVDDLVGLSIKGDHGSGLIEVRKRNAKAHENLTAVGGAAEKTSYRKALVLRVDDAA